MALFTLLLASLIGLALAFSGMYEVKVARNYNTSTEAFYIAEAGLNHAIHAIESNSLTFSDVLNGVDGISGTADDGVLTLSAILKPIGSPQPASIAAPDPTRCMLPTAAAARRPPWWLPPPAAARTAPSRCLRRN